MLGRFFHTLERFRSGSLGVEEPPSTRTSVFQWVVDLLRCLSGSDVI